MEFHSLIKKNEIMPLAATWMDLEIIILSKVSQKEKDKYHMIPLICGILKKWYKWTYLQNKTQKFTEIDSQASKTNLRLPKWKGGGGIKEEVGINIYTLLYIK